MRYSAEADGRPAKASNVTSKLAGSMSSCRAFRCPLPLSRALASTTRVSCCSVLALSCDQPSTSAVLSRPQSGMIMLDPYM
eukprot:3868156-Alexandrium_andersonii.AAC.1